MLTQPQRGNTIPIKLMNLPLEIEDKTMMCGLGLNIIITAYLKIRFHSYSRIKSVLYISGALI